MTAQSQSDLMWRRSRTKVVLTKRSDLDIYKMDHDDNGLTNYLTEDYSSEEEQEKEDKHHNVTKTDKGTDEEKKIEEQELRFGSCSNNNFDNKLTLITGNKAKATVNQHEGIDTSSVDELDACLSRGDPVYGRAENVILHQGQVNAINTDDIDSVDTVLSRTSGKTVCFEQGDTQDPQKQRSKYAPTTTPATNVFKNNNDNVRGKKKPKFEPSVKFGLFDYLVGLLSISLFFVDIGTDIELAVHYFRNNMLVYGGVTTGMIVVPSLVTCFLGLHWYIIDCNKEKKMLQEVHALGPRAKVYQTPNYVWCLRFFFTLLQCGPAIRVIEYLYYGYKSKSRHIDLWERKRYYRFMLYQDTDSCLLRLFESFLEAAPQLTWQLYIVIDLKPKEDVAGTSLRALAMLSSWGSLALSLTSYHKSLRNSHKDKAVMKLKSLPLYFIWRACETGGRILCIAMFASAFKLWVFGPLIFHWAFMSGWLIMHRTNFYKNKCMEKVFNIICGYVMIFCFLNLREGQTRFRFLLFYFILYTENFIMLALWFRFTQDLGAWFHLWGFIVVLLLFVFHVTFQLLYYVFLHPTNNIDLSLTCERSVIFSSICYEVQPTATGAGDDSEAITSLEAA